MTGVRNRLLIIIAVVAASVWAIYPPRDKLKLGLDLSGGVQLVLRVKTGNAAAEERRETVDRALRTIERRVDELGVSEPVVARYGSEDRILVELPGVTAVAHAKAIIKSTAQLRLTLVEGGPYAGREAALVSRGPALPGDLEVLPGPPNARPEPRAVQREGPQSDVDSTFYVVRKAPVVSGTDLRDARHSVDEFNRPAVAFSLTPDAAARFSDFTAHHVNRTLATVLDNRVTSVATILSRIDGHGQIQGLSREEMIEQVIAFKSGALPADLEYVEERTIGASLGESSIRSGITASAGGLTLVLAFMLAYYRLAGLNALASIVLNLLILIGLAAIVPVTFTLPGIAGLILTIGMGVDSNVLIFERIKEELARARSTRAAVGAGFDRVWITIVDTHVTSLIAAALLFQFGTSPIRGFATMLTIGLLANVFTAVFVSKTLFELVLRRRGATVVRLSIGRGLAPTAMPAIDFNRWSRLAAALSLAVILAGSVRLGTRGLPLGIDFTGGTLVVVQFAQPGVTEEAVRRAVAPIPGDEIVQRYGSPDERRFVVRLPIAAVSDTDAALESAARRVTEALQAAGLPRFEVVNRELVSAAIGKDLQWRGIQATAASIAGIAIYIALRFRYSFAIGGIAATLHDVLVTLACLALAGYDLTLNVTAALLTIVGYSVNDTIVIFDRVRENARAHRAGSFAALVNMSVNQTLSRTLITAGATLLAVVSLYWFGGEALRGFAFTMLVGIVSGTYSTIFIASPIASMLNRHKVRTARPAHGSLEAGSLSGE